MSRRKFVVPPTMPRARAVPIMAPMSEPGQAHFKLAIAVSAEPIRGTVSSAGPATRPFTGWMELFAALEAAVCAARAEVRTEQSTEERA